MSNFHFLFCLELIFTPPASPESLPARWPAAICYCSFQNITISSCFGLWMVCSVQGCFCSQDNSPTFPTRVVRLSLVVGDTSVCSRSRRLLSLEITATLNPASIQRSETLNSQRWFRKGHDSEQKCVHVHSDVYQCQSTTWWVTDTSSREKMRLNSYSFSKSRCS